MTLRTFTAPSDASIRWAALPVVGLAGMLVLAGCGGTADPGTLPAGTAPPDAQVRLFSDDFEGVCQGRPSPRRRGTSRRAPRTR